MAHNDQDVHDNVWGHDNPPKLSEPVDEHAAETQRLLEEEWEPQHTVDDPGVQIPLPVARAFMIRALALLCACSLSVGSH